MMAEGGARMGSVHRTVHEQAHRLAVSWSRRPRVDVRDTA